MPDMPELENKEFWRGYSYGLENSAQDEVRYEAVQELRKFCVEKALDATKYHGGNVIEIAKMIEDYILGLEAE